MFNKSANKSAGPDNAMRQYALGATIAMAICAPLGALSYFATKDGAEELENSTVSAWAEPARQLFEPLLTFADPDRVYATYSLVGALSVPLLALAAWTVRRSRAQVAGKVERVVSFIVAVAWACFSTGLMVATVALQFDPADADGSSIVNIAFLALMLPGMMLALLSSTVLGGIWLRRGVKPRLGVVILLLAIPMMILGSDVLGHNSLAIVPQMIAWTLLVWPVSASAFDQSTEPAAVPTRVS